MVQLGRVTRRGRRKGAIFALCSQGISFKACRLSARRGWKVLECVAHSGRGQETLTEVSSSLHYGEERAVSVSGMWAVLPQTHTEEGKLQMWTLHFSQFVPALLPVPSHQVSHTDKRNHTPFHLGICIYISCFTVSSESSAFSEAPGQQKIARHQELQILVTSATRFVG